MEQLQIIRTLIVMQLLNEELDELKGITNIYRQKTKSLTNQLEKQLNLYLPTGKDFNLKEAEQFNYIVEGRRKELKNIKESID